MKRVIISVMLVILLCVSFTSAITGSIGNARMILREVDGRDIQVGDIIERTILVKNVNNVPVDISLFASGDLADDTTVVDDKFTLGAGDEKKAQFNIIVTKSGTTETNINVKFSPQDGANGVGLSSTVIIIAGENSFWSNIFGGDDDTVDDSDSDGQTDVITGSAVSDSGKKLNPVLIVVLMGMVFLVLLMVLLVVMLNKKKIGATKPKKRVRGRG